MVKRIKQVEDEKRRNHSIKLAEIKARAMRDYLIAQNIPLREVAEAVRNLKIRQSVNIGRVNSSSYLKIGAVSNTSAITNNNTDISDNNTKIDIDVKK